MNSIRHLLNCVAASAVFLVLPGTQSFGSTWIQVAPSGGPGVGVGPCTTLGIAGHEMVYDSLRGRVVLYGGNLCSIDNLHTWEWDGTSWTMNAATGPARSGAKMAYDSARDRIVLYGGQQGSTYPSDTWEWNGLLPRSGDLDGNGSTNGADILPFVGALSAASTVPHDLAAGDFNNNGVIDSGDIPAFVGSLLSS